MYLAFLKVSRTFQPEAAFISANGLNSDIEMLKVFERFLMNIISMRIS